MAVDDLWYLSKRGPDGERVPSKRYERGKRWRVRYTDDAGRPRTQLFERKIDADRFDAGVRTDVSRGQYIDERRGRESFREYAERHRREQVLRDSTASRMERSFRLHVDPIIGDLPVGKIRQAQVRNWVKDRSGVLAPSTLALIFVNIKTVFRAAMVDKVRGDDPTIGVRLPELDDEEMVIPTPEQVHQLAAELPPRWRAVPYLVAGTGLRPGEVFGLEVEHVAFLQREVSVAQQLLTLTGREPFLTRLKTKTSRRTVELPDIAGAALAEHLRRFPPVPVEIDDETDPRRPVRRTAMLIFTNEHQRPLHRSNWSHIWEGPARAIGLPKGAGLHVLRHYHASLLIEAGASVKTVQMALGHSSPTITLNTYVHLWPDVVDRTRSLVDAALGQVPLGIQAEAS